MPAGVGGCPLGEEMSLQVGFQRFMHHGAKEKDRLCPQASTAIVDGAGKTKVIYEKV